MIDINGKKFNDQDIIDDLTLGTSSDYIDAQWLKKNIAMQTLPNGLCSLPVVARVESYPPINNSAPVLMMTSLMT